MLNEVELERLLERVRGHPDEEPAFFRRLLEAQVHAHVPRSDDHPRVRFIQFRHPEGFYAIPFFTSMDKARVAAGHTARIVTLTGQQFLETTRGATMMLNPNDGGCVLYPEEIAALLATGTVARFDKDDMAQDGPFLVSKQADPPAWLIPLLFAACSRMPFIEAGYLLKRVLPDASSRSSLLVVLAVPRAYAERAARALITAVQPRCLKAKVALELTTFDPVAEKPAFLCQPSVERFYGHRASLVGSPSIPTDMQAAESRRRKP